MESKELGLKEGNMVVDGAQDRTAALDTFCL